MKRCSHGTQFFLLVALAVFVLGCQPQPGPAPAATSAPATEQAGAAAKVSVGNVPPPNIKPLVTVDDVVNNAKKGNKPNILVIMGDDIGITNISAYSLGMMGYQTPNIDKIASEGAIFTDYYGEQSCTAGRSAFITGQSLFRVGLTKVGMPGAKQGISDKDPTIAELLKPLGYTSGQFGKNHLGDRNEYLPTVHGFDEYAGVLYHLNALEEPENVDYPKDPDFFRKFGPRDSIHTWATEKFDKTEDPRFGVVGKQKIKSTGPVTIERMKTYDDETLAQSIDFIERAVKDNKPFFVWHNTTRTHTFTPSCTKMHPSQKG
jgi:arylsulfatase